MYYLFITIDLYYAVMRVGSRRTVPVSTYRWMYSSNKQFMEGRQYCVSVSLSPSMRHHKKNIYFFFRYFEHNTTVKNRLSVFTSIYQHQTCPASSFTLKRLSNFFLLFYTTISHCRPFWMEFIRKIIKD